MAKKDNSNRSFHFWYYFHLGSREYVTSTPVTDEMFLSKGKFWALQNLPFDERFLCGGSALLPSTRF